ncbi:MAG: Rpn family recombination-promoting nuclease/putative transposase [Nocardia sp.]|nr:Rpn family recombination-promoting nuclease/putative transposase [Nocardia sp.]
MGAAQDNPHDSVFRLIMSSPSAATRELQSVLPEWLVTLIDWDAMELASSRYVLDDLRNRDGDVLFKAPMAGRDGFIHLMLEHQSTPDKHMPLRALEYTIGIWNQHLTEHPHAEHYPLVVPVVVNSGPNTWRWNHSTELWDRIGNDHSIRQRLGDLVPRFRVVVDDLARVDFTELYARDLTPVVLLMLILHRIAYKNQHLDRDLGPHIKVLEAVEESPNGRHDLLALFTYISKVSETSARDLARVVDQLGPLTKEAAMTTAEQLRADERAHMLLRLLSLKFGQLPDATIQRVKAADADQFEVWTERVLTANSLDEFFGPS